MEHSTRAPAVGYRMTAGEVAIFYVPDVVWIHAREEALSGCKVYVGDGATLTRSMVRKSGDTLTHAGAHSAYLVPEDGRATGHHCSLWI